MTATIPTPDGRNSRVRVRLADGSEEFGVLSTDHPASSYGLPVVVLDDGTALGAAECKIIGG